MTDLFEVRDHRNKAMFRVDDEYLNGYSKLCGVNATMVYLCLCRHADRHQESFPSVKLMADKTGISERSVVRGIQTLIDWNIISKERERKKDAKWLNNRYVLLDKSVWKPKPHATQSLGNTTSQVPETTEPHANDDKSHMPHSHTKDTHIKVTHNKYSNSSELPFVWEEYLEKLETNKNRGIEIIGFYFKEKGIKCDTRGEAHATVKRYLKVASQVKHFDDKKIIKAIDEVKKQYPDMWTLETVYKQLTK